MSFFGKLKVLEFGKSRANYIDMQRKFYSQGTSNHLEHNDNEDYWEFLLSKPTSVDMKALDFGCGKGRNVDNLKKLGWHFVDGCDISSHNIEYCRTVFHSSKHSFFVTSGTNTGSVNANSYDLVISTITLQHIPVYSIRKEIIEDIFRVLKPNGLFSFQMGFGADLIDQLVRPRSGYFEESTNAFSTNGNHDVRITNQDEVVSDLEDIGFTEIRATIRKSFSDVGHPQWIYVECRKPS